MREFDSGGTARSASRPSGCGSARRAGEKGSVLIIVLWIAFGLVSLALYFADSMNYEMHASENRVAAQAADQAIEGAARYISYVLSTQIANGSNGCLPVLDPSLCQGVPIGECRFWLIGRNNTNLVNQNMMSFGLVDEASKLNLNTVTSNQVIWLPWMNADFAQAILDWRDTNATGPTVAFYAVQQPPYQCKSEVFETIDELRLLYGANMDALVGEDLNRNGYLDPNETDQNQDRLPQPGALEYVTAWTQEPNTNTNNVNISSVSPGPNSPLGALLSTNFGSARANQILESVGLGQTPGAGGGGSNPTGAGQAVRFSGALDFYVRSQSRQNPITSAEFAQIATNLTVGTNTVIQGRVNVNTASLPVLTCLLGGDSGSAQQLFDYRQSAAGSLNSVAWLVDACGQGNTAILTNLLTGDFVTTQTYQVSADIAAVGPHGRGFRRVKFVFDTSSGTPQIVYRQDLTYLGWALGPEVREQLRTGQGLRPAQPTRASTTPATRLAAGSDTRTGRPRSAAALSPRPTLLAKATQ